jgi:hypothetical protein
VSEVKNRHSESRVREIRMPGLTGGDWKRSQTTETSPVAYPTILLFKQHFRDNYSVDT